MLQQSYKTQAEIPEGIREHYAEREGVFVLDGYVPKSKLDEFRENNRGLSKKTGELEAQLLKFKDIDPTKYSEAVQKLQELENDRLAGAGEYKLLKANLEQQHAEAIKAEKAKAKALQDNWNKERIANQTAMIVMKYAVPEEGNMKYVQADILEKATIDPDTNKIVFLDEKGLKTKNEAGEDLTLEEFLTKQYIPHSKLFKKSTGGGALGAGDIPMVTRNTVHVDNISGKDISGDMFSKLASGEIQAVR